MFPHFVFFFYDTATPDSYTLSYTLSLHEALPISAIHVGRINSRELESVTASLVPLAPLMKATGGTALWQGSAPSAKKAFPRLLMNNKGRQMHGPGWLALADRQAYQVRTSSTIPLFSGLLALALLLGALSLTWLREGR